MPQQNKDVLNPNRFITRIRTSNEFLASLPKHELPRDERQHAIQRAIATSALSLANHEKEGSGNDLDANLLEMISGLQGFYESSRLLDQLRERYGGPQRMTPETRDLFYEAKDTIIEFNDTLVEVINSGASQFDFDELLTFMTNMFSAGNNLGSDHVAGRRRIADFSSRARESLVGMRNEMAVEQLLIYGDVDFRRGTVEEDSKGGDYFVEGVPIDFKSDERSAERSRLRAEEGGYDSSGILWSHVTPRDFEGKLTLPYNKCAAIFAKLKPDLDAAIAAHKHPQTAHAI